MQQPQINLSAASGLPFYRQVVDQMSHLIRSGQLAPGTRLPSIRELASQLLVSLITTRRAYADLEAAGLIVRRQGLGTFVADDVQTASRKQAREEARSLLSDVVTRAQQMGLDDQEIRSSVDELLEKEGGADE